MLNYIKMSLIRKILIGFVIGLVIGGGYALYLVNNPTSPLETVQLNEANDVSITYSRPYKKDRLIFGNASDEVLVPYDNYWRTGANRHTYIENTKDLSIDANAMPTKLPLKLKIGPPLLPLLIAAVVIKNSSLNVLLITPCVNIGIYNPSPTAG